MPQHAPLLSAQISTCHGWLIGILGALSLLGVNSALAQNTAAGGCLSGITECQNGPAVGLNPTTCDVFDADSDQDVDMVDVALHQRFIATDITITQASFTRGNDELIVRGSFNSPTPNVTLRVRDNESGELLASSVRAGSSGTFEFVISSPIDIPCFVQVDAGLPCTGASQVVIGAPSWCSPQPTDNEPPYCMILLPSSEVSINLGESVVFSGTASDPEGGPLTYEWSFGGGADIRSKVQNPGAVTFDWNNGSFLVRFIVTDDHGARCEDSVVVNVGLPPEGLPPMVAQQPAHGEPGSGNGDYVVIAFNDLGMHCGDLSSYPMSILPPFNTLNAVLIRKPQSGSPLPVITDDANIELRYSAASNPNDPVGPGSINSTSINYPIGAKLRDAVIRKTDFWDEFQMTGMSVVQWLIGLNPIPDEGLQTIDNPDHGRFMPGILSPYVDNVPQTFGKYLDEFGWFTAQGIPVTGVDDRGRPNSYPLMRVQAIEKLSGTVLATIDGVTPVSSEVDCRDCHTMGTVGADPTARINGPQFIAPDSPDRIDVETAAKLNLMKLHDFKHGTTLIADGTPVLCAVCHRSNALATVGGPVGDPNVASMSNVAHGFHGKLQVDELGNLLRDAQGEPILADPFNPPASDRFLISNDIHAPMEENCFKCHPGKLTQCFRGVMFTAGQTCISCHGNMLAVGGEYPLQTTGQPRIPWADEPKCASCHTGHGSDPVRNIVYDPTDPSATPLPPIDDRFAENPNTLYRNSRDAHANVACEACHGSPHAIWPHRDVNANDNVPSLQLQGYVGPIRECTVCHQANSFPNGTLNGPHGMHPVNSPQWIKGEGDGWHGHFAENEGGGPDKCAPCHGADHLGTRLARVPVNRIMRDAEGVVRATLAAGEVVRCNLCHSLQTSFGDD